MGMKAVDRLSFNWFVLQVNCNSFKMSSPKNSSIDRIARLLKELGCQLVKSLGNNNYGKLLAILGTFRIQFPPTN
ncbi:hypothetical protein PL9631_1060165 [Planktothrix paucivesiculata PCC 9631]|uniref:Uncharacterized protein n=1 Tax=Planktothrix paucivesiculata PCC 9631 TaxID=671071 RepID=A0A7Z9DY72_9CYAN|nr:hypothetical protein PL9631_1060165 [Planktothrix paucivesiculata PCC 9631]